MKENIGMPHFPHDMKYLKVGGQGAIFDKLRIEWDSYWTVDSTIDENFDIVYYYIEKDER